MNAPELAVVATPIGNLDDLSERAIETLRAADLIACEDTRRTRVLTQRIGARAELVALHRHNEAQRSEHVIEAARAGRAVALVSDAGSPSVSDPGALLVARAHAAGLTVTTVPGASAVMAALAAAGLPADAFCFLGFFPRSDGDRERLLDRLDPLRTTLVGFESPKRLPSLISWLADREGERELVLCRELTKLHEQVLRAPARRLAAEITEPVRGEVTLVLAPTTLAPAETDLDPALDLLRAQGVGPRAASEIIAALGAASPNAAYRAAIAHADASDDPL